MSSFCIDSPFQGNSFDWGDLNTLLIALLIMVIPYSLFDLSAAPPPLQHAGNNDWRIVSSVQFIQASTHKQPTPVVEKKTLKPVEQKKPAQVKPKSEIKKPRPIISAKVTKTSPPIQKAIATPVETAEVEETIEVLPKQTEKLAEVENSTKETTEPQQQQNISPLINNLTASLVSQPAGVPLAEYRSQIIEQINNNKSYPKAARRRGLQGGVEVSFTIANDGSVIDLECLADTTILSRSACEAIKKSLPFPKPEQTKLQLSFIMDYVLM